jgi:hypothetical protein
MKKLMPYITGAIKHGITIFGSKKQAADQAPYAMFLCIFFIINFLVILNQLPNQTPLKSWMKFGIMLLLQ